MAGQQQHEATRGVGRPAQRSNSCNVCAAGQGRRDAVEATAGRRMVFEKGYGPTEERSEETSESFWLNVELAQ